jgi:hypothetical protein
MAYSSWYNASTAVSRQRTVHITLLFYVTKEHPVYMRTKTRKSELIAHMFHLQFLLRSVQAVSFIFVLLFGGNVIQSKFSLPFLLCNFSSLSRLIASLVTSCHSTRLQTANFLIILSSILCTYLQFCYGLNSSSHLTLNKGTMC